MSTGGLQGSTGPAISANELFAFPPSRLLKKAIDHSHRGFVIIPPTQLVVCSYSAYEGDRRRI